MKGADLSGCYLSDRDLRKADFSGANLQGGRWEWIDLRGANLSGANLSGLKLIHVKLQGANLQGANLTNTRLSFAYMEGANLVDAKFKDTDLGGANLKGADLSGANLEGIYLGGVTLKGANLTNANLQSSIGATLEQCNAQGADFRVARSLTLKGGTNIEGADLRGAFGGGGARWDPIAQLDLKDTIGTPAHMPLESLLPDGREPFSRQEKTPSDGQ